MPRDSAAQREIDEFCQSKTNDAYGLYDLSRKLKIAKAITLRNCDPNSLANKATNTPNEHKRYALDIFSRTQLEGPGHIDPAAIAYDNYHREQLSKSDYGQKVLKYSEASLVFSQCEAYKNFLEKLDGEQKAQAELFKRAIISGLLVLASIVAVGIICVFAPTALALFSSFMILGSVSIITQICISTANSHLITQIDELRSTVPPVFSEGPEPRRSIPAFFGGFVGQEPTFSNAINNRDSFINSFEATVLNAIYKIKARVLEIRNSFGALFETTISIQPSVNTLAALNLEVSKAPKLKTIAKASRLANIARGTDDDRLDQEIAAPTSRPLYGLYHI